MVVLKKFLIEISRTEKKKIMVNKVTDIIYGKIKYWFVQIKYLLFILKCSLKIKIKCVGRLNYKHYCVLIITIKNKNNYYSVCA